jgi:uncharacterized protein YbaR (Trm112 family)
MIEIVQCPSCGSRALQVEDNKYQCEYCNTVFILVNKNIKKIIHEGSIRAGTIFCPECGRGLPLVDKSGSQNYGYKCVKCGKENICVHCVKAYDRKFYCDSCYEEITGRKKKRTNITSANSKIPRFSAIRFHSLILIGLAVLLGWIFVFLDDVISDFFFVGLFVVFPIYIIVASWLSRSPSISALSGFMIMAGVAILVPDELLGSEEGFLFFSMSVIAYVVIGIVLGIFFSRRTNS